ncbi:MAG: hypothetical protein EBS61_05610 [Betaproteobacteria bacterium]|nr:hypothetical protein [Betaproteobacteria bacterium]
MTQQIMGGEPVVIRTTDGTDLQGVLYVPNGHYRRAVLVAGGLGIPQRFYTPFASWLALRGNLVLTFDLRGMGASRRPEHRRSLRGLDADMLTWARKDFPAAVQTLLERAGSKSISLTPWYR